jgi:2-polyprenyl-3-methyl-5-hydroxy-6-metoxy-1,4-benzoquinol methylase
MIDHPNSVEQHRRFQFGKNWARFLKALDMERIAAAEQSLREMLELENLEGKSFLDIGSGSGLFSLAARRLGARVHSFDYDPDSVACTKELKHLYFAGDPDWTFERGSVLDEHYMQSLGEFDIVYSWGVLHHTGALWQALANATIPVAEGGNLFIAIYNDQGFKSRLWQYVKKYYCSGKSQRALIVILFFPAFILGSLAVDLIKLKNPMRSYREYKKNRGMSVLRDWLDWLGGYPFEVAKPDEVVEYYKIKGYKLEKIKTCGKRMGNNEYFLSRSKNTTF